MKPLKIGLGFGLWRLGIPKPDAIMRVAESAEEWGLDSFWLSDHLLAPSPELDVVAILALLAGRTTRLKLGPSVLLLNLRHPILVAKAFASLDYISAGRIVMAVGTGANLADYAACGVPLASRGRRLDEGIEVLRTLWLKQPASFHGEFYNFDGVSLEPCPIPRHNNGFGTIDIWVGGRSEAALKRVARLGDGFFATAQSPAEFATAMAAIRNYAAEYGRANARIEAGMILLCRVSASRRRALEETEPLLGRLEPERAKRFIDNAIFGNPDDIARRLEDYAAEGLDKFVLWPLATPEEWPRQVELIGRELATPLLRGG